MCPHLAWHGASTGDRQTVRKAAAIALSLYDYLIKTVERLAAKGVKSEKASLRNVLYLFVEMGIKPLAAEPNWRTWKYSFITGCSKRLSESTEEQHNPIDYRLFGLLGTDITIKPVLALRQKFVSSTIV